jgi:Xaa-Pro dipeptidase
MKIKHIVIIASLLPFTACQHMQEHNQQLPEPQLQWTEGLISSETAKEELSHKISHIQEYLLKKEKRMVVFGTERNIKWLTGGYFNSQIVLNKESAAVHLAVDLSGALYVLSNTIEVQRALDEGLKELGFNPLVYEWYLPEKLPQIMDDAFGGLEGILSDGKEPWLEPMPSDFREIRFILHPLELRRYRALALEVTAAVEEVCHQLQPGMTEKEMEALTAMALWKRGILPTVLLMAVDERISDYRHALPSGASLEKMAMVNVVAEKWNMPVAITRFVHFGPLPGETQKKFEAVAYVNANYQKATKVGQNVRGIFGSMQSWYEEAGYRWEWEKHHQGGAIGYDDREYVIRPGVSHIIRENQAFAWNPTITGSKMEETILATADGFELLTRSLSEWPMVDVEIDGEIYPQPWVLIKD